MRIHKIEIENIRGIKKLTLEPKGRSLVVFGPNGSGKSAIVDAIDFLLTGKISRLEGEGSDELSTKKHGPHVDHDTKEAIVRADVEIPASKGTFPIERRMSTPNKIICGVKNIKLLAPSLDISELGQHRLSRREILKYIIATAGTRASQIHSLLDLEMMDKTRKTLVSVKNSLEKEHKTASDSVDKAKTRIKVQLGIAEFSETETLKKINEKRTILNAAPLSLLHPEDLIKDIETKFAKRDDSERDVSSLRRSSSGVKEILKKKEILLSKVNPLKSEIVNLKADAELMKEIKHRRLVELGLELLDDRKVCPLCERAWETSDLMNFLKRRIDESIKGGDRLKKIKKEADDIRKGILEYQPVLSNMQQQYAQIGLNKHKKTLDGICDQVSSVVGVLLDPMEENFDGNEIIEQLISRNNIQNIVDQIDAETSSFKSDIPADLEAWTALAQLKVLLEQLSFETSDSAKKEVIYKQAEAILAHYETARDDVLHDIYSAINADFTAIVNLQQAVDT